MIWNKPHFEFDELSTFIDDLCKVRGITDIDDFLSVSKKKLHNPYLMKDLKLAVQRIISAVNAGEKIGIFGDYDADGVTSTSLWLGVLQELGVDDIVYFVPDRHKDGYGLGTRGVQYMIDEKVDLVITCDTGITAVARVADLTNAGIDVIITDHHEPQLAEAYEEAVVKQGIIVDDYLLPKCTAVVNMKRPDCKYPFKGLAGVGVSFKILCAVAEKVHPEKRKLVYKFMDLVAIGTIADMMDLIDENRSIVHHGLKKLNTTKNRGLYQLLRASKLNDKELTSQDIGWSLAPAINAAGRIVSAEQAVDMILSMNKLDAYRYAKGLVEVNTQRKELTKTYVDNVIKSIEAEDNNEMIIVSYIPNVPEGIIGLIAGRVMHHFNRPCIILSDSDNPELIKGSGRSIESLDLFSALMNYTDMINFGGHHAACGLSLNREDFDQFKESLQFYVSTMLSPKEAVKQITPDCLITGNDITMDLVDEISVLQPFGAKNKEPLFQVNNAFVMKEKPVGENKDHLWMLLKIGTQTFSGIGFFMYPEYEKINKPRKVDIIFKPDINEFPAGKFNVQIKAEAIRAHQ